MQDSKQAAAKGFKAAKEADRRASAGNRAAWNTLFMRPDTVAAAIAEHYGVSRAELLDREASGASLAFSDVDSRTALDMTSHELQGYHSWRHCWLALAVAW